MGQLLIATACGTAADVRTSRLREVKWGLSAQTNRVQRMFYITAIIKQNHFEAVACVYFPYTIKHFLLILFNNSGDIEPSPLTHYNGVT